MSAVRPMTEADLPSVAAIFQKVFRQAHGPAPDGLVACLRELLFAHPRHDPDLPSLVHGSPDGIDGFIGVLPLPMVLEDWHVRGATPTSLAVADPVKSPMAGALLLRAFLAGAQDISVSEPINPVAGAMWERSGAVTVTSDSMEWLAPFRPAAFALAQAAERFASLRLARPLAVPLDRIARRFSAREDGKASRTVSEEVDRERFIPAFLELATAYDLRPDWDAASLGWQLAHADGNRLRGPLSHHLVMDRKGAVIGAYLYQGQPGGLVWVVQVLARPEHAEMVVGAMLAQLRDAGFSAAKGRTQARLLEGLLKNGALLFRRHSAMVHARDIALIDAVREGRAITGGLAGETWTRLVSDRFS